MTGWYVTIKVEEDTSPTLLFQRRFSRYCALYSECTDPRVTRGSAIYFSELRVPHHKRN